MQLQEIAQQARQNPEMVFTTLAHLMDVDYLREAHRRVNKRGAPGLDKVTAAEYGEHLGENLAELHQRLRGGRYKAPPIKRVWIDKENGRSAPSAYPSSRTRSSKERWKCC